MSKELEMLKNIEKEVEDFEGFDESTRYQMDRTRFQIIEAALIQAQKDKKELEEIKSAINQGVIASQWAHDYNHEKELKALEIIKEQLRYFIDYDESTKTIYVDGAIDCDNQEYELLKEILK